MTANFDIKMTNNVQQKVTQKPDLLKSGEFAEQLRHVGLRPTRQRIAIAALLLDVRHRHVTADSLTEEITAAGFQVSGSTVYNTLNQFTDAGLLRRVTVHNEYSLFDTNTARHHHFYEAAHDRLIDIPADQVLLSRLPQAPADHDITGVDVVIHIQKK